MQHLRKKKKGAQKPRHTETYQSWSSSSSNKIINFIPPSTTSTSTWIDRPTSKRRTRNAVCRKKAIFLLFLFSIFRDKVATAIFVVSAASVPGNGAAAAICRQIFKSFFATDADVGVTVTCRGCHPRQRFVFLSITHSLSLLSRVLSLSLGLSIRYLVQ